MKTGLRHTIQVLVLAVACLMSASAFAQGQEEALPDFKQIKLTDQHVKSFIAAQSGLNAMSKRLEAAGDKDDPTLDADLEALAKKHGFANFEELEDVAANISFVFDGIDPKTGNYSDPASDIKKELEEVKADKSLSAEDRKKHIEQLESDLKVVPTLKFKENVDTVKRHIKDLEAMAK